MANTLKFGNGEWYGKEDTILAYNDERNNIKPLPFSFERGSVATRINKEGLIETVGTNEPRIDFKDDSKGAMLLEPSRTNKVDNTVNFFINSWTGARVIEGGTTTALDGNNAAHKLIPNTDNNSHYKQFNISSAAAGSYTSSVFFKKGGYNTATVRLQVNNAADRFTVRFNLEDGTFINSTTIGSPTGTAYKIEDYGGGWYRLSVTVSHTSGTVGTLISVAPSTASGDIPVFIGDGTSGAYAWGAQLEQGSYATSYIPTQGSAVTRLAEECSQTVPSGVIGQTEGTMFIDFEFDYSDSNTQVLYKANQSTDANSVGIEIVGTTIKGLVNSGGSNIANIQGTVATGTIKAAIAYKTNDIVFYVNGTQIGVDTSGSIAFGGVVDILTIGKLLLNGASYFPASRPFNQAQLYNTRLSNSELIALTQV